MAKRVFLIVLDSFGVGAEPDAPQFGDAGTNTLGAIANHPNFKGDNLAKLGMFNLLYFSLCFYAKQEFSGLNVQ